ncbi:hypothetical protein [Epilithonimonas hominis]|uniref:hypothetical protein n=1 Tax=Epilithonimonas hominis TaxID=420404 RepID=UPI000EDBA652|nr:hypothetical protein [Epilithonimonas hominis]HAP95834.1 hypothetical protein [Chryseobacterium sp.]
MEKLYYISSKKPSDRKILVTYNECGFLIGFRLHGSGWSNEMVARCPQLIPMRIQDFEKKKDRYKLIIEKYK